MDQDNSGAIAWFLNNMPLYSIITGGFLAVFGVYSYISAAQSSITPLIPTFIGLGLLLPGWLAYSNPEMKKHGMHAAAVFALIGTLGGLMAIPAIIDGDWSGSTIAQLVLLLFCGEYMFFSIMSFRAARIKREQEAEN
jgi:predicted MFS family arabinose efflux permease